uniref:2-polyprenyl-3-methyl-5-hydroxy-6-metoxy-1,4-benzoquinol methylase n=1 Tax=Candidatus Kentrum sp. FM TaxID=2126340 RepID=A0A450T2M1_9GAMM|nr:MAG: 2-polyprenyl-3-methyl-5-hydroxy-6-metoxy-1,4-benzoquinol methylase [Candidatus Kentron sp. FM]VFJ66620.1 MAG: 2-polyprenyl-3-methyl-5-hydroxy-6-metoxy-1,4-benzoquinol methylase [Candidatus Kentron sp. FM]VFK12888.1 MAG: 2-polyprenyl-3-methyl-5-hydroxy-6-metoxy-1,4-benzoquinol methylase [Candidatus Kentron sp. FM]
MESFYNRTDDGIFKPAIPVQHRDNEYPEGIFATLWAMQERHFWYRGRHRFLLHTLGRHRPVGSGSLAIVDLGGGVGGWVRYLADRRPGHYQPLALADSSRTALRMAGDMLPEGVERYQIDLMKLGWRDHWDIAFLLDVLEHLPDDLRALRQARAALKPGGLLFVTTPAFQQFWSHNDELAHHLRRYTRADFARLGKQAGLQLCDARYFMFLLSPLYWLVRQGRRIEGMTEEQKMALIHKTHQVPSALFNLPLTAICAAETPLGHWIRFPWGTSVLGVFRK